MLQTFRSTPNSHVQTIPVRPVAGRGYVGEYSEQEEAPEEAEDDMDDPSASSRIYTSAGTCGMSSRASSTGRS